MTIRLSQSRRSDRFAAATLALGLLAIAAAALVPVVPGRSDGAGRAGVALPTPPGSAVEGAYRRASPFDVQHRPVDETAVLPSGVEPVVDLAPVAEAPARIAGILVGGSARKVMFAGGEGWQGIGSAIGGWTVSAIEPQRVTLRRGGETLVLRSRDALLPQ
ncbi:MULTISPECIES: hypothetical protein [unclassified Aureimonas]|uniref:hypothetical protein n=1 Tax=unclassified Aureimonas TaxID=2615206 RepID=UPI0006FF1284|nr:MULTISPECIES: hypothetical protein [unclassified Aureimonas]KQT69873.1 hypothetical protein ASG62_01860 [Aureimonas sp. Leaf427]KQT75973.1 hypothetical protein ASG54_14360 [Aureimonas sp. Leaf460]